MPDEMILQSNLLGTEEMVLERIRKHRDAGVTTLRVQPTGESFEDRLDCLARVTHLVKEVTAE